ncbi:MAG: hypothetical protein ACOYNL_10815, partial [Rickettsiales bacterium]
MQLFSHTAKNARTITPLTAATLPAWLKRQDSRTQSWVKAQSFEALPATALLIPDSQGGIETVLA